MLLHPLLLTTNLSVVGSPFPTDESAEESIRKLRAEIAERESKMKELTSTGDGPESSTTNDLKAAKRPRM